MKSSINGPYIHRRSSERLRYAVDVAQKSVNDAFKIFSIGKRPYHQLFSDVCQDINAQLDTLNLLIKPLIEAAPLYDFEDVEANGIRSVLGVVDCILKELISHVRYCIDKHSSFFFNGTNAAAKLARFCLVLSRLGKMLDITTAMHQQLGGKELFIEVNNPVGALCMKEYEGISRECFYGQLVGLHYIPQIRNIMKGICVALCSYGIGYYSEAPRSFGQPQSLLWKGSASVISGAKYLMREEERARKFVELTHNCATIDFTKSFWNLFSCGPLADVPKMMNKRVDVACQIFIEGEPLYVKNRHGQMILMHPPVGKLGFAGVTVGFLSSKFREGQVAAPPPSSTTENPLPPKRFPKSRRLLVHFHGGGFVSGSHIQHETYLRSWCSDLDAVVVSINYSLAPENPFPKGLDDCVFAYAWCLENLHTLGCTGKSIVFVGDSAGGNLAISTAMRAQSYGLRSPDGVLAAYPVTYVKYAGSVSRLLSSLDIMLPSGVLQCCLRAYSGVPVDSNAGFYQWLQTADSKPAEEEVEEEEDATPEISDGNSKYISDVCRNLTSDELSDPMEAMTRDDTRDEARDIPKADAVHVTSPQSEPSTCELKTSECPESPVVCEDDSQGNDSGIEEPVELDTIRLNPIVFGTSDIRPVSSNHSLSEEENVLSPDVEVGNVLSPDVEENNVLSQDVEENNVLSPDVEVDNVLSQDVEENNVLSPDVDENNVLSPDVEEDNVLSPDVEENNVLSPDVEEDNVLSPDVEVGNVLSTDAEEDNVLSPDVEENNVLSTDVEMERGLVDVMLPDVEEGEGGNRHEVCQEHIDNNISSEYLQTINADFNADYKNEDDSNDKPDEYEVIKSDTEENIGELPHTLEDIEDYNLQETRQNVEEEATSEGATTNNEDVTIDTIANNNEETVAVVNNNEEVADGDVLPENPSEDDSYDKVTEDTDSDESDDKSDNKSDDKSEVELAAPQKPDDDDLERMLYEDDETRFKGAKLVLTPDRKGAERSTPPPVTPTRVFKQATVVRDIADDLYDLEPAYVINPGEIATRNNATLLQKYFDDPFMSPYLADNQTLADLPPIHIVGAEFDPLLDDSVAFCRRMKSAGGRVSLEIVPGMTHGFLNLVLSSSACAAAAKQCQDAITRLFDG